MSKVGLKDTLALIAKGFSKKEIEALAAIDDEHETDPEVPAPEPEAPAPEPEAPAPEPEAPADPKPADAKITEDLKKQMEELQAKLKESEEKLKKIQQGNVHTDSAPDLEKKKKEQTESLNDLIRSYM